MSSVIAVVKSVIGQVIALTPEGAQRLLIEGDRLFMGEQLTTGAAGMVSLQLSDGRTLDLGRDTQWSAAGPETQASPQPTGSAVSELQQAIAAGTDPTAALAPTAAGPQAPQAADGGGGSSHSFVILETTAGQLEATVGFATQSFARAGGEQDAQAANTDDGSAANLAPVFTLADATGLTLSAPEDTPLVGSFSAADRNGDTLTFSLLDTPSNGALSLSPSGEWSYSPNPNYNGPDSFQIAVSDGRGGVTTLTLTLDITPRNDAPVAEAGSAAADEGDTAIGGQLLASDVDQPAGTALTFSSPSTVAGLTLNADGSWSFDPHNAAYDSLALGQQLILDIPVSVTDDQGATGTTSLRITLTGTNDAPVATATSVGTMEDVDALFGQLMASDVDSGIALTYSLDAAAPVGFSLDAATGAWTFATTDASYQTLAEGEVRVFTLPFTVTDEHGATSQSVLTLSVTGGNDGPTTDSQVSAAAVEDGALLSGQLVASDIDNDAVLSFTLDGGTAPGFSLDSATGEWTFDPSDVAYQALAAGEQLLISLPFTVTDQHGATSQNVLTLTVTGSNDTPTATESSATAVEDDAVLGGQLAASDIDNGTVLTFGLIDAAPAGFSLDGATGTWTFDPSDAAYQALAAGEQLLISLPFTVTDEHGATSQSLLSLTVTGTNDVPIVAAALKAAADEDDASFSLDLLAGAADVDNGAALGVTNVSSLPAGVTLLGSTLTVDPAHAAYQDLAAGEERLITVSYLVVDGQGGSVAQTATISITGTNDVPVATATDTAVVEDDAVLSGQLKASDVDHSAVLSFSLNQSAPAGFSLDSATGTWTFDPSDATYQALAEGEVQVIDLPFTVTDERGATSQSVLTLTVTGSNDAPLSSATSAAVVEDDAVLSGQLVASDVDHNTVLTFSLNQAAPAGFSLDSATGTWTFDPSDAAYQALAAGEQLLISLPFRVTDEHGATSQSALSLTLTGSNDAPTVAAALSAATNEDDASLSLDLLAGAGDVDNGAVLGVTNVSSLPPGVTLLGSTLTVDPTHAAYQDLAAGEERQITVSYDVVDDKGSLVAQTLTLTITGSNDAPVVSASSASTGQNAVLNASVPAASDIDGSIAANGYALVGGVSQGSLTFNADGTYSFDPGSDFDDLAEGAFREVSFSYSASDNDGAVSAPASV
ncbi:MAG: retention module-containing protein, partial [Pseudomonas sp.]